MTDLNSLVIFARIIDAGSFSEAARRLQLPTSTVSRRIAELEAQLGVRLLERSTRSLRLTSVGTEVLEHAQRTAALGEAVSSIASNHLTHLSGVLRLSAPPSISDSLLAPLACAFQAEHPDVRIQILVTERMVDHIAEGIDLVFRIGALKDSSLIARRILTYRHQLLASPSYLSAHPPPRNPQDLLQHRLLTFARWKPDDRWIFHHRNGADKQTLLIRPHLSLNDYAGLASALLAGAGIGELPPLVQPGLLRDRRLVEVMPHWRFRTVDLSLLHLGNRLVPRSVRVFTDFAARLAPQLFPNLPKATPPRPPRSPSAKMKR